MVLDAVKWQAKSKLLINRVKFRLYHIVSIEIDVLKCHLTNLSLMSFGVK